MQTRISPAIDSETAADDVRLTARPSSVNLLNGLIGAAALGVMTFLYFPMGMVVLYSFNPDTVNSFPMRGFSLKWYGIMTQNESLQQALKISLLVAVCGTVVALVIGVTGALAMQQYDFRLKRFFERVMLLPITLPGILTGVAMLSFFPLLGIPISLTAVTIGHTTFLICIVLTQVYARLKRLDPFLEEAAADLGATPVQAFFRVVLPNIRTALIGAALLSFTLSLDEIPVTFFLIARDNTLPIEIYTMMRRGITPEVNAISTVIFALSLLALLLTVRYGERETRPIAGA
ncbi:ABC transporter permease [Tellurirhabdus rosea]|uniref:ABC transporter permease n=1 Tax=Tellurirhabdus rosea TaxID=2674997 RepID=UPI002250EA3D|nr:ABC transporter permease [Tellurirhabdus rosea]